MERYKGIKRHEVPPHVFAITDNAYRSMLQGNYNVYLLLLCIFIHLRTIYTRSYSSLLIFIAMPTKIDDLAQLNAHKVSVKSFLSRT